MTSTLLHKPSTELNLLLWSGQLKTVRFNEYAALCFLSSALGALRDAKTQSLSPIGRYTVAHEGIYALCLGSLYLHGLLPAGHEGSKAMTLQVSTEMLGLTQRDQDKILYANSLLEEIVTGGPVPVEVRAVLDLVYTGDRAVNRARETYPDWFI